MQLMLIPNPDTCHIPNTRCTACGEMSFEDFSRTITIKKCFLCGHSYTKEKVLEDIGEAVKKIIGYDCSSSEMIKIPRGKYLLRDDVLRMIDRLTNKLDFIYP